jgi:hypothetical protein
MRDGTSVSLAFRRSDRDWSLSQSKSIAMNETWFGLIRSSDVSIR